MKVLKIVLQCLGLLLGLLAIFVLGESWQFWPASPRKFLASAAAVLWTGYFLQALTLRFFIKEK